MQNLTDEQLVAQYNAGDQTALDFLIQRHLPAVYNFVFKYVHSVEEAEDVSQESFVKAWKNIHKFNPKYKFKTWLFTIAKNTALDHLKKRGLVPFSELDAEKEGQFEQTLVSYEELPEEMMNRISDMELLGHAVSGLPSKYAKIIDLYYNDELNFREISELLKESINTIKTRHRRALALIKRNLGK